MKKLIMLLLAVICMMIVCPVSFAQQDDRELDDLRERIDSRLDDALDDETKSELESSGVTPSDAASVTGLDIRDIFRSLYCKFCEALKRPLSVFGKILAVSLISAVMNILCTDSAGLNKSFSVLSVICVITVIGDTFYETIEGLKASLNEINTFMIAYIPVFSAVTAAGGQTASAGVYSSSTLLLCEAAEFIASGVLVPLMSVITAITIISSVDPQLKISGAAAAIRRFSVWLLSALMLIFVGVLSIQGVTGSAADSLVSKTLRFTASSFIPVIGGSVSDAFTAVKSGMGVIKAAVGGFGMLAVSFIAVRPLFLLISMRITLWAGRIANELLGSRQISDLMKDLDNVMSVGTSVLIAITSSFVIATAAVISLAAGV